MTTPIPTPQTTPVKNFPRRPKRIFIILGIVLVLILLSGFYFISQTLNKPKRQATYYSPTSYVTDQLIIKYKTGINPNASAELDKKVGVISKEQLYHPATKDDDLERFYLLKLKPGNDILQIENLYLKENYIESTEPNFIMHSLITIPNDTYYSQLWGLQKIQMPQAWGLNTGSSSVKVAILDTGMDNNHPDLPHNVTQYNALTNTSNAQDDHFHGTHVAGTIAALTNNNLGVSGINWNVSLMIVKVLGSNGSGDGSANGLIYAADHGAKVVNMSLGTSIHRDGYIHCDPSFGFQSAINYAVSRGVLVIVAAGNDGNDANFVTPASCSGVLTVGATDPADQRASFSNYGNIVRISAPGVSILSTKLANIQTSECQASSDPGYMYCSGTSMATPHVVGVAALLFAQNQFWNAQQVTNCLLTSADPITTDLPIGGRRLNAFRALSNCGSTAPLPPPPPVGPPPPPSAEPCNITGATWGAPSNPVLEGTIVNLNVQVSGNCTGKQISFDIFESSPVLQGGDRPSATKPQTITINGNTGSSTWGAEYIPDGPAGIFDPPEYYFNAKIVGGTALLRSANPDLKVTKKSTGGTLPPPPTITPPPPISPPPPDDLPLPPGTIPPPPPSSVIPPSEAVPTESPEPTYTCRDEIVPSSGSPIDAFQIKIRKLVCQLMS